MPRRSVAAGGGHEPASVSVTRLIAGERLVRSVHSLDAIAAPLPRVDLRVDASLLLASVASEALLDGARVVLADVLDRSFGLGLLV